MKQTNDKCPHCGEDHEAPFSNEVVSLARRIFELPSGPERAQLVMELAEKYAEESDWSNLNLPEELHTLMEDYVQAKAHLSGTSFRLGRFLLRGIGAFLEHAHPPEKSGEGKKADPNPLN